MLLLRFVFVCVVLFFGEVLGLMSSRLGPRALRSYSVTLRRSNAQVPSASSQLQQSSKQQHEDAADIVICKQVGTVAVKSGLVRSAYATLRTSTLCGAQCVVVEAPTPATFEFPDTSHLQANHRILYSARDDDITTEEVIFGRVKEQTNKARLNKFIGGRIALRRALSLVGDRLQGTPFAPPAGGAGLQISDTGSIMRDAWGAPQLTPGLTGSISHKDFLCVGAAAFDSRGRVGVDLEHCNNKAATTLWRRILTEDEKKHLGGLKALGVTTEEEVLLHFSFKEAVYKAIHPILKRSIDFQEVEVFPSVDGAATVNFRLKSGEKYDYKASWERYRDKYWLTCIYCVTPEAS